MAAVTLLGTATWNTTNGTKTVTATPAVGDLIVIITAHSGNSSSAAPTDDNNGGTYTHEKTAVKASSADRMSVWIRNDFIRSATSTIFTHAPGTTTGGGLVVLKITGMSRCGITNAIVQSANQDNGAAATPSPVFATGATTTNAIIGAVYNATNPAGLTPRTGYLERVDLGHNSPASGIEVMSRDSGETASIITWGGASASAWCSLVIELNAASTPIKRQSFIGVG
jgi:hypothetical protein